MTEVKNAAAPAAEPTSPKLVELKANGKTLASAWQKTEYGTKEFNDAKLAMLQNEKEISAELSAIAKADAEKKLAVLRSEKVAFIATYKAAVLADAKKSNDETKAAEQAAYEALVNLVLPAAAVKSATASSAGGGTKGAVSAEIEAGIIAEMKSGKTATEAVKALQTNAYNNGEGYSRGTTGAVRTQMVKDGKISEAGALLV